MTTRPSIAFGNIFNIPIMNPTNDIVLGVFAVSMPILVFLDTLFEKKERKKFLKGGGGGFDITQDYLVYPSYWPYDNEYEIHNEDDAIQYQSSGSHYSKLPSEGSTPHVNIYQQTYMDQGGYSKLSSYYTVPPTYTGYSSIKTKFPIAHEKFQTPSPYPHHEKVKVSDDYSSHSHFENNINVEPSTLEFHSHFQKYNRRQGLAQDTYSDNKDSSLNSNNIPKSEVEDMEESNLFSKDEAMSDSESFNSILRGENSHQNSAIGPMSEPIDAMHDSNLQDAAAPKRKPRDIEDVPAPRENISPGIKPSKVVSLTEEQRIEIGASRSITEDQASVYTKLASLMATSGMDGTNCLKFIICTLAEKQNSYGNTEHDEQQEGSTIVSTTSASAPAKEPKSKKPTGFKPKKKRKGPKSSLLADIAAALLLPKDNQPLGEYVDAATNAATTRSCGDRFPGCPASLAAILKTFLYMA